MTTQNSIFLNIDDEFDRLHFSKIINIKVDFKEYFEKNGIPLFNKKCVKDNFFFKFIKFNSINYKNTITFVNTENERILEEEANENDNPDDFGDTFYNSKNQKYYFST